MYGSEVDKAFISQVDITRPIGWMVENYANQKWWKGFYLGWTCSCVIIATCILVTKK